VAVGSDGSVVRTTDGGASWENHPVTGVRLYAVHFPTSLVGTAAGGDGVICRTTDGGISWNAQSSGTSSTLRGVWFNDVNNGYATGHSGTMLRTTNGGVTWFALPRQTTAFLYHICFTDTLHGATCGWSGALLHTRVPGEGVEEREALTTTGLVRAVRAGIVRGVLELPPNLPTADCYLLSISGRKVMGLHPGANDVSRLAPGVYFVRAVSRGQSVESCHKVVIQR
jgi:photosystem II stability/assembly factor-like uncharacterized protein